MPSAREKPVVITTRPATAVAMNANRSVSTCWKAPSTFRLRRLAPARIAVATRFTAIPAIATTSTGSPSTSGGLDQAADALVEDHNRQGHQRRPVELGREDLGPAEAEGEAASRGPAGQAGGQQGQGDRAGVGEHVGRVRQQRQRGREHAHHDLDRHEAEDQDQREQEPAGVAGGAGRVLVMCVGHAARMVARGRDRAARPG